jgi:hypothetical protein
LVNEAFEAVDFVECAAGSEACGVAAEGQDAATAIVSVPSRTVDAMAADLGLRKSYLPVVETPAPSPSPWTGAYAGVNAGGGFGTVKDPTVITAFSRPKKSGDLRRLYCSVTQRWRN